MSKSTSTRASTSMFSSAHDLTFQGTQSFNAAGHDMYTPTIAPTINVNFTAGPVTNNIPIGQVDGQSSLLAGLIQPSSQKPRRGNSFREFAARLIGSLVQGPSETTSGSSSAETGSPQASAEQSTHSVSESSSYRSANGACTVSLIEDLDALFAKETLTTPEIYTTSLLGSGKGLACWQPHPNPPYAGETGIVPGDVGTFDAEDGFCKIFNLWDDEAGLKARAQTSGVFYTSPGRETVCREDLRQDETVVRGTSTDIEYTRDGR
ncbi:hypothetical protein DFP72DRAFT_342991 [Ephemerocybe angulata]|uniref:Uncharacterized protein n=1 Tax=Ephemerocybe angulata TaxID=980116 RepID=A0A8H6H6U4_9AGAR|nr:hypothetical protein DFP72DRAFT_342991 [Tulosesus angulatus]